ncbi:hypothetical protein B0T16DRAFT_3480 [Cercophora newfieldiana]|uniref:Secreted protein n=1 Tax=Cercophora newfieldiana TaxID=92897 RepID=A0AA39YNB7_9PEZI|nr:hypothetical protein B0T16DRAFT_3480 [Cercophora newfieldiana]
MPVTGSPITSFQLMSVWTSCLFVALTSSVVQKGQLAAALPGRNSSYLHTWAVSSLLSVFVANRPLVCPVASAAGTRLVTRAAMHATRYSTFAVPRALL